LRFLTTPQAQLSCAVSAETNTWGVEIFEFENSPDDLRAGELRFLITPQMIYELGS
jgi:hypothetical protein